MVLNAKDYEVFAEIVNQGIDSHLEAVHATADDTGRVAIKDTASMKCFIRRCTESDNERAHDMASSIINFLGFEWI